MKKNSTIILDADPNDPEDFPVTEEALQIGLAARRIRRARESLGLTQLQFARKFKVPVGTLRDWEQARVKPPAFALAYVAVIAAFPEMVEKVVA